MEHPPVQNGASAQANLMASGTQLFASPCYTRRELPFFRTATKLKHRRGCQRSFAPEAAPMLDLLRRIGIAS